MWVRINVFEYKTIWEGEVVEPPIPQKTNKKANSIGTESHISFKYVIQILVTDSTGKVVLSSFQVPPPLKGKFINHEFSFSDVSIASVSHKLSREKKNTWLEMNGRLIPLWANISNLFIRRVDLQ